MAHARGFVVGDLHGTVEAPAFVRDLVCQLLQSHRGVLLALEYPADEQRFLDDFLRAPAGIAAGALLASPFWSRPSQDGRSSRAMLELLLWVRQQVASGAHIRVLAFDALAAPPQAGSAVAFDARDAAMAVSVARGLDTLGFQEVVVIFTGNVHARKTQGLPFVGAPASAEHAEPLGYRLKERGFLHLNISYRGGSLWACMADGCGVHQGLPPGPAVSSFSITASADPAYDLEYFVGRVTASPPAAAAAGGQTSQSP
jgi:hypothetical protein